MSANSSRRARIIFACVTAFSCEALSCYQAQCIKGIHGMAKTIRG